MAEFFGKIVDIFTDLTPSALIGSLAIAMALALIGAGAHVLIRGRGGRDPLAPLCGLMFAVSLVSMAIGVGYLRMSLGEARTRPGKAGPASTPGRAILDAADVDRDGHLTADEAAGLVRRADTHRNGYADLFELDHARMPDPGAVMLAQATGDQPEEPSPASPKSCWGSRSPMVWGACFPPAGGLTGHDVWPMISRHTGPSTRPKM